MRDLFKERDLGIFRGSFTSVVDNHGVIVLRIATTRHVAGCCSRVHKKTSQAIVTCVNALHDRPMVGLEAWRPWSCDPAAGDTCDQDLQAGKLGARIFTSPYMLGI